MAKIKKEEITNGIAIDCETGGVDSKKNALLSVGLYINDSKKDYFFINPNSNLSVEEKHCPSLEYQKRNI